MKLSLLQTSNDIKSSSGLAKGNLHLGNDEVYDAFKLIDMHMIKCCSVCALSA